MISILLGPKSYRSEQYGAGIQRKAPHTVLLPMIIFVHSSP